ncbi:MAG TPA: A/G-specific adenine glycosylase [Rhabdochlamydiaceae bacterium]
MKKIPFPSDLIAEWFLENRRDLPWRNRPSPYAVWISEIMLQQTQVSVVRGYFLKWMECFPTVSCLAEAPQEKVLKMWEGLGYYSRARNIHAAARYFVEKWEGKIPPDPEELKKVKGLGPYTIGAILSFAFHKKAPAVDANVARLLSRYFCIEEDISQPSARDRIWEIANAILPEKEPWVVMEGLIELGALVCKRLPQCGDCPLQETCSARKAGKQSALPLKKRPLSITHMQRAVFVIYCQGEFLLRKGSSGAVMADLYEFPYCEKKEDLGEYIKAHFPFPIEVKYALNEQTHSFTRYKVILFPMVWIALEKKSVPGYHWLSWEKMQSLPFSSGHRRILRDIHYEDFT